MSIMHSDTDSHPSEHTVFITEDVRTYILARKRDFRVSTSCSGPILLPTSVKPPKMTDLRVMVGDYTIYISKYQARYLDTIHKGMIPIFFDDF